MCTKEISAFQKCYKDFKVTYEAQKTSRYTQTELAILIILMNLSIVGIKAGCRWVRLWRWLDGRWRSTWGSSPRARGAARQTLTTLTTRTGDPGPSLQPLVKLVCSPCVIEIYFENKINGICILLGFIKLPLQTRKQCRRWVWSDWWLSYSVVATSPLTLTHTSDSEAVQCSVRVCVVNTVISG